MKVFTFVIGAILSTLVAGNAALKEDIYDILKVRSWSPAIKPRSGLQARACLATCNNGGCCNTGGPCTTDGMCCQTGEFACTDGGCCQTGETCGTSNGTQVCQSNTGCTAPPVTCGSSCCDAGMVCVKVGTNLRCEAASTTATSTSKVSVTTPVLGDSLPKNSTFSRPTTTANLSAFTSQSVIKVTTSQAISPSSTAAAAATTSSKSSSSALRQSLSVSELQGMMSLIAGVAVAVVLVMVN
jgi:hypothetical protein